MPDLDALVVAFQTQLSDVMEAVVKTAMFEVTRLVEDVFLVEVKRRRQELESLRMQLQRAEEQVGEDKGGPKNRAESSGLEERADSGETGELQEGKSSDLKGLMGSVCGSTEQSCPSFPDMMPGCDVKTQRDAVGCWMSSLKLDIEDEPAATQNPEPNSQVSQLSTDLTYLAVTVTLQA